MKKARLVVDGASSVGVGFALFYLRDSKNKSFDEGVNEHYSS